MTGCFIKSKQGMSSWRMALVIFLCCVTPILLLKHCTVLVRSTTDSLPYASYLWIPSLRWQQPQDLKSTFTIFSHPRTSHKLIKKIVGVASDVLHYDVDGVLWVNEQRIGLPQPCTRCQQPLHKIEPGLIPSGFVFVAGTHPRSFDSRYQEVGLIAIERLEGLVIPLWKFKDRVDHEL